MVNARRFGPDPAGRIDAAVEPARGGVAGLESVRWRAVALDTAVGALLAWVCWVGARVHWEGPPRGSGRGPWEHGAGPGPQVDLIALSPYAIGFLVLLAAALGVRRIWPRAAFVGVVVAVGGFLASGAAFGPVFLAPMLAVYAMAVVPPIRRWAPLTVLLLPMIVAGHWREPYLGFLDPALYAQLFGGTAIALLPAMFGLVRRGRIEAFRRERDLDRRRYAYEERLRIAREVHDVVGHSLAVINLQAGVAAHLLDRRPDQAAESLEAIRKTSKEALAELRSTLQVFREPEDGRAPLPGLARLDDLVGSLRAAGRDVTVRRVGDAGDLPAAVDQAAFRIVQEALTNLVRHTAAARAVVRIQATPAALWLEISDDAGPAPTPLVEGNGIRGMRERARALGGNLEIDRSSTGGVVVRASLPRTPSDVAFADPLPPAPPGGPSGAYAAVADQAGG